MIKVLHLIHDPDMEGPAKTILSLGEKLHDKGCVFFLGYSEEGPLVENARSLGVKTLNIPIKSSCDLRAAIMLKDVCREFGVDIVHSHFPRELYISLFSRILGNRAGIVNTCHLPLKGNPLLAVLNSLASLFAGGLIAASHAVLRRMTAEGIDSRLVQVIPNGVDLNFWRGRRSGKVRKELGIGRDEFVITASEKFSDEKSPIFFLEVVRQMKKSAAFRNIEVFDKVRFLLMGDGEFLEECRNFAEMSGISEIVFFLGYRSDRKRILYDSDLFISHTENEASGISILEALACGLPVVAVNGADASEIIGEAGDCGTLVERNDADSLAEAIFTYLSDRKFYKACKANAVFVIKEKFNLDKLSEDTYNLYKKCLPAGRSAK